MAAMSVRWRRSRSIRLMQLAAATRDTRHHEARRAERGLVEQITDGLRRSIMTLALLVLTVVAVPAAWRFRQTLHEGQPAARPDLRRHRRRSCDTRSAIADNVNYITTSVRSGRRSR